MNYRLCGNINLELFTSANLLKSKVNYFDCPICGYVQTETPSWLDEAYASPINSSDTGIMVRNLANTSLVVATLTCMGNRSGLVVDYAGGYGILVRLLRDAGIDAYWADPYSENLVVRGFEYQGLEGTKLVTAFEAFEHFVNPYDEMKALLSIAPNILLTTNVISTPAPSPSDWWYYGLEHGQHIGFYRVRTLQQLADKFGLHLLTDGVSKHFFSEKKYSYSAWRILMRSARYFPKLFSFGLKSKTWSDHLKFQTIF